MQLELDRPTPIGKRGFLLLVLIELLVLVMVLTLSPRVLLPILLLTVGVVLFVLLPVVPYILLPAMIVATSLDYGGIIARDVKFLGVVDAPITAFHIAEALAILACIANILWKRQIRIPRLQLIPPLLTFLTLIGISSLYAPGKVAALFDFFRMLFLAMIVFITAILVKNKSIVTLVISSIIGCAVVTASIGIYQTATSHYFLPAEFVNLVGASISRAAATFTNPNMFATFLTVAIVLGFTLLINLKLSARWKICLVTANVILAAGLITSFSRTNWLASAVGFLFAAFACRKVKMLSIVLVVFLCVVLIAGVISSNFRDLVVGRFVSIFTTFTEFKSTARLSSTSRVYLAKAAVAMFLDHPLLGIGTRGYPQVFPKYRPIEYPIWFPVKECHTYPAVVLAELGILGFAAFFWFVIVVFKAGIEGIRALRDGYLKTVMIGLVAVFISFQVNMLFTADVRNNYFWLTIGMLFAVREIGMRSQSSENRA